MINKYPKIDVGLLLDDEFAWDPNRGCAYCERQTNGSFLVGVAPHMLEARHARLKGVLMHEFGHAVLLHLGDEDHSERDADTMGEHLFNEHIFYDEEDIQSTDVGVRPRPMYLDCEDGCLPPLV